MAEVQVSREEEATKAGKEVKKAEEEAPAEMAKGDKAQELHDAVEDKAGEKEIESKNEEPEFAVAEEVPKLKRTEELNEEESGIVKERKFENEEGKETETNIAPHVLERKVSFKERDLVPDLSDGEKTASLKLKTEFEDVVPAPKDGEEIGDELNEEKEESKVEKAEYNRLESSSSNREKTFSFKEECTLICDLKESEKKALTELKLKVEEAILHNKLLDDETKKVVEPSKDGKASETVEKSTLESEENAEITNDEDDDNEEKDVRIHKDISIWGVPLLPSKGDERTDVVLLKFLRAREFNAGDSLEMLKNTLKWRKENNIDSILGEDLGSDFQSVAYMSSLDRAGHPVCYNIYGIFEDEQLYQKTFGTEENCKKLLRWRLQMMEREIRKLNFEPGGISSFLQINDLKDSPGPSRKELRQVMKQAVSLLQDNYPEFVAINVFINVPFWYYALYALLSPFLTQRTKSKFVFARPAKVTETLLRFIPAEGIPIYYGGLKRDKDDDFSDEDSGIIELTVKSGSTETIEIPTPEVGSTTIWDLTVMGWEVSYKEEFVPTDENSYMLIIRKNKKIGANGEPIRNSFMNKEPGKITLIIENSTFKRKKVLYRFKVKSSSSEE